METSTMTRDRLVRFFEHHNPSKLEAVDKILAMYVDRDDDLFADLVAKYGPEPSLPAPEVVDEAQPPPSSAEDDTDETTQPADSIDAKEAAEGAQQTIVIPRARRCRVDRYQQLSNVSADDGPDAESTSLSSSAPATAPHQKERSALPPLEPIAVERPPACTAPEEDTYPAESEMWIRVVATNSTVSAKEYRERVMSVTRMRSYSESAGDDLGETMRRAGVGDSANTGVDANDDTAVQTLAGQLPDGQRLCSMCSKRVLRAQKALWTPIAFRMRLLTQTHDHKEGWLEKLNANSHMFGGAWSRRYMRANDKGIHYYESDRPEALKKARGSKFFTSETSVVATVDELKRHSSDCNDSGFHYFALKLSHPDHYFVLRTPSADVKAEWVSFLETALENFQATVIGQDPNVGRWAARLGGVVDVANRIKAEHRHEAEATHEIEQDIKALEDEIRLLEEQDEDFALELENCDVQEHAVLSEASGIDQELAAAREQLAASTSTLESRLHECVREQDEIRNYLSRAEDRAAAAEGRSTTLEAEVRAAQTELLEWRIKSKKVFQKWRRSEQRTPKEQEVRARHHSGLAFTPTKHPRS
eukprot:PhM_4_TR15222/c0_g1_i2/m.33708